MKASERGEGGRNVCRFAGGRRPGRSDSVLSKATWCGVSVVEQLGLTVGQDLDLWRIWTLARPRRHEGVQVLQTGHLQHNETAARLTSRTLDRMLTLAVPVVAKEECWFSSSNAVKSKNAKE